MLWGCWAAIDILGNSTQERTKPRKKKTDVPEELACLKCAVVVCSQVSDDHGNLLCIALNQRPNPQTADWLVTGWCSFSSICFKRLTLPSLNLKLFCNVSSYRSCYKNKSYIILNSCTRNKKNHTENTGYGQIQLASKLESDRIHSALRYKLSIHIQRINSCLQEL